MLGNRYLSGKKGFLGCKRHFNMKYSPGREGPRQGCKDQEEEDGGMGMNLRGAGFWFLGAVTK
jgi:hypothetical protein